MRRLIRLWWSCYYVVRRWHRASRFVDATAWDSMGEQEYNEHVEQRRRDEQRERIRKAIRKSGKD